MVLERAQIHTETFKLKDQIWGEKMMKCTLNFPKNGNYKKYFLVHEIYFNSGLLGYQEPDLNSFYISIYHLKAKVNGIFL